MSQNTKHGYWLVLFVAQTYDYYDVSNVKRKGTTAYSPPKMSLLGLNKRPTQSNSSSTMLTRSLGTPTKKLTRGRMPRNSKRETWINWFCYMYPAMIFINYNKQLTLYRKLSTCFLQEMLQISLCTQDAND